MVADTFHAPEMYPGATLAALVADTPVSGEIRHYAQNPSMSAMAWLQQLTLRFEKQKAPTNAKMHERRRIPTTVAYRNLSMTPLVPLRWILRIDKGVQCHLRLGFASV